MKIVVLGAGAIGSLVGALLSLDHSVTLLCRRSHADAIALEGLRVSGATGVHVRLSAIFEATKLPEADLAIVTTKAHDTAAVLEAARGSIGPRAVVLTLQNGLSNLDTVVAAVGPERALAGVTTHGVTFVEPGHVHHAGAGYTVVGGPAGRKQAERVAAAFSNAGLKTEVVADIESELWAKAIVNAAINPITAIVGMENGVLLADAALAAISERAAAEASTVARAAGIVLPPGEIAERVRVTCRLTAANKSSMLQDVERGRRTEIDSITGRIVALGKRHGVDTPVNATLLALVHGIERSVRGWTAREIGGASLLSHG